MPKQWLFDRDWTRKFTEIRQEFLSEFLDATRASLHLVSALDVGCGLGDFCGFLQKRNFRVTGVDGRSENVAEAVRRHSGVKFIVADAEELSVAALGTFDLVLCLGLLYHLENPFRTLRQLHSLTGSVLIVEGMCVPDRFPSMGLFDEVSDDDQSLNRVAFYPSEACLIKMLYCAGFPSVYSLRTPLVHDLFTGTTWRKPARTILVASKVPISMPNLSLAKNRVLLPPDTSSPWSVAEWDPWSTGVSGLGRLGNRVLTSGRLMRARVLRPFKKLVGL